MSRRAVALALVLLALAVAVFPPLASGTVTPRSAELVDHDGDVFCRAARTADGWYTARHCLFGSPRFVIRGRWLPFSLDPSRDLAHFADTAADVALRAWAGGERTIIANDRMVGYFDVDGLRFYTQTTFGYEDATAETIGARALVAACYREGQHVRGGDSGSPVAAMSDGALLGVLVASSSASPIASENRECGAAQTVLFEPIP